MRVDTVRIALLAVVGLCSMHAVSSMGLVLSANQLDSVTALNAELASAETDRDRSVGFLSQGNYESVHTILHSSAVPVILEGTSELIAAVDAGDVVAGLMSGSVTQSEQALP